MPMTDIQSEELEYDISCRTASSRAVRVIERLHQLNHNAGAFFPSNTDDRQPLYSASTDPHTPPCNR